MSEVTSELTKAPPSASDTEKALSRKSEDGMARFDTKGNPICRLCGLGHPDMSKHLELSHEISVKEYSERYPDWPLIVKKVTGLGEGLSFLDRKTSTFLVSELFGFIWKKRSGDPYPEKDVFGFAESGPLTPKVDPFYVFDPKITQAALIGMHLGDKILNVGPTGSGKSSFWRQIAARLNFNFIRINFDAGVTRPDLVGQWVVKNSDMVFAYGALAQGMALPGTIMCLDEWDAASEETAFVLQRPLEEESQLLLLEKGDEVVSLHSANIIVATSNTTGMGDDTGLYSTGTRVQNWATINRFSMTIPMDYLAKEKEEQILLRRFAEHGLTEKEAKAIVKIGNSTRSSAENRDIAAPLSTRDLVNWTQKYLLMGDIEDAALYCFVYRAPREDQDVLRGLVRRGWTGA